MKNTILLILGFTAAVILQSCANTRDLTRAESDQITQQLQGQAQKYSECYSKYGAKQSGAIQVKYVLEFGGKWAGVEVDDEKSSDYTPEMKDCILDAVRSTKLGVKPRTKIMGTYRVNFAGG